jgi:hypothetical protein
VAVEEQHKPKLCPCGQPVRSYQGGRCELCWIMGNYRYWRGPLTVNTGGRADRPKVKAKLVHHQPTEPQARQPELVGNLLDHQSYCDLPEKLPGCLE